MKKGLFILISALIALSVTGCISPKVTEKTVEEYKIAATEGTPENSVVFIGMIPQSFSVVFTQIKPRGSHDVQEFKFGITNASGIIVSKPVKPGSQYIISHMDGSSSGGFSRTSWNIDYTEDNKTFLIDIPEEPGYYYFGSYLGLDVALDPATVIKDEYYMGEDKEKILRPQKLLLEQAIKYYKGTEWETEALKNISELEK
jgi:hypothetical protein